MARKPKANPVVDTETKPAPMPDVQTAVSPDAVDQAVAAAAAAIDDGEISAGVRRRRPDVVLCMPVLYRAERPHNGQHDLAGIVTGIDGDDPHGRAVVWATVFPPRGEPFSVRASEAVDYDAPADGTWRFPF